MEEDLVDGEGVIAMESWLDGFQVVEDISFVLLKELFGAGVT